MGERRERERERGARMEAVVAPYRCANGARGQGRQGQKKHIAATKGNVSHRTKVMHIVSEEDMG